MAIFTRLSNLIKANINDMIDRAEDPEKMVHQIISDMEDELTDATYALGKAIAAEKLVARQCAEADSNVAEWEENAKIALKEGNGPLARQAVEKKLSAMETAAQFKQIQETVSSQTEAIRSQVNIIKDRLMDAKSREAMLVARSQMADTQKDLARTVGGMGSGTAFDRMSKMEEKINRKEAQAQAFTEIAGNPAADATTDEFTKIKTEAAVEAELKRLSEEMTLNEEK